MRRNSGFNLIEVMTVVVIIGILSVVAYPTYQRYLLRSQRSDAQAFMMKIDARQRQVLIEQRNYATTPDALSVSAQGWTCGGGNCSNGRYTVTFNPAVNMGATPPSYTICALPTPVQAEDGALTLSSTGVRQRLVTPLPAAQSCTSGTDKGW